MEESFTYTRARSEFGRHPRFTDKDGAIIGDVPAEPGLNAQFIQKATCEHEFSCIPVMAEHVANTVTVQMMQRGMAHTEGGWPKEVDTSEVPQVQRYKNKIERDEDFRKTIMRVGKGLETHLKANNAIDIYQEYYAGKEIDDTGDETARASTKAVFRDPCAIKRWATQICWRPDTSDKLAVAYCPLSFQSFPEGMSMSSFIWDMHNSNTPDQELQPNSPLCSLQYNPKDIHQILGGCYNGLVALWDLRAGGRARLDTESTIEKSHHDPVYRVAWFQSKTGTECGSVSTDGHVMIWDTRRMNEPIDTIEIRSKEDKDDAKNSLLGGVVLEYDHAAGATKFMVGTEQGRILNYDRKGKTPQEKLKGEYVGHHGPVCALQRNPLDPKCFLSVGDWTARIWNEDLKTPLMTTGYDGSYLTDGCWSPTRPGVFYTTKQNGQLECWDFFYKQQDPVVSVNVNDSGIQCLTIDKEGQFLACGARDGSVHTYEMSSGLRTPQHSEKQSVNQMLQSNIGARKFGLASTRAQGENDER